jgi:hypothetical protein
MMKIPPISRKRVYEHCLNLALQQPAVNGECYWKLDKPIWISLYQYPTDSKDGDNAWRFLHNTVVTPRRLYQWKKRKKDNCPWCDSVSGTVEHMFLECQHATRLWNQVEKLLERLLGSHNINRKIVIFGYQRFYSTAYQLANCVIIMAKSTIYKTYMASADEEGRTPNYYRLLMMRLK